MVTVTTCAVPSAVSAVKLSVSVALPLSACTAAIVVVERVGPHAGGRQLVGAVAVGGGGAGRHRLPGVVRVLSTSVASRSPVSVGVPGVPLSTPPASVTSPAASPVMDGGVVLRRRW